MPKFLVTIRRRGWFRKWRPVGEFSTLDEALAFAKGFYAADYKIVQEWAAGGCS